MILAISIFVLTLAGKLAFDLKQHQAGKKIDHKGESCLVILLLLTATLCFTWNFFITLPCFLLIFWALFDSGFGLLIARNPFFLGDSSWLDRVQKKEPALQIAKYLMAILSVLILIYAK